MKSGEEEKFNGARKDSNDAISKINEIIADVGESKEKGKKSKVKSK